MAKCRNCMLNVLHKEDGQQFSWCLAKLDNFDIDELRECDLFIQATNADKIRAMSDEELAEWLATAIARHYNQDAVVTSVDSVLWLDWLKQEVSDG